MLKIRLMGTKNDIKWFEKLLERQPKVAVTEVSEMYRNKGTNRFYRAYAHREQVIRERERAALHKETMKNLVRYVRRFMELFGYELVWITYRDPETGQEWKKK